MVIVVDCCVMIFECSQKKKDVLPRKALKSQLFFQFSPQSSYARLSQLLNFTSAIPSLLHMMSVGENKVMVIYQ